MKGMERITTVRLAEVLSQNGVLPTEKITDALYQQDSSGIPFAEVLVENGDISEWELARVAVQHFQLPFLMMSSVEINKAAVTALPEDFLFEHRLLPIDLCGNVLTLSMPILVPYKVLTQAQTLSSKNIFPLIGLASENVKFLTEIFPKRPAAALRRAKQQVEDGGGSWENIFDIGDQEVLKDLGM